MKLEDKVALVTGAGRGIGGEIAVSFALEGASVGVNDLTEERTSGTVAKIGEMGREALSLPADASEERPVREMVEKLLERFAVLLAANPDGNLYTGQTLDPNLGDVMP